MGCPGHMGTDALWDMDLKKCILSRVGPLEGRWEDQSQRLALVSTDYTIP